MFFNPLRKRDLDRRRRSSNIFSAKEDTAKVINKRLQIITVVICVLFAVIGVRLVQIQLLSQEEYTEKLEAFTAQNQSFTASRGGIYDRNGTRLAWSEKALMIYYYPPENISNKEEWALAEKFVDVIDISLTKKNNNGAEQAAITDRQLKDMHYLYETQMGEEKDSFNSLLTDEELADWKSGKMDDDEAYALKIDRMDDIVDVTKLDDHTKKVYLTKMLMDQSPESEFKVIIEDATEEQTAILTERQTEFGGFQSIVGWKRDYYKNNDDVIKSLLGSVSSSTQGLPADLSSHYMGLGYSINQRVGISGVEKQYEDLLSGTDKVYSISYDENGIGQLTQVQDGKNGYDLTLTIDMDLQNRVNDKLTEVLERENGKAARTYFDSIYFVAMDPNTGEVLAMVAVQKDDEGKATTDPTLTYLLSERAGSVVKMATVYMGLDQGVVSAVERIPDTPIQIKGSEAFASSRSNNGNITAQQAIAYSSNVYMAHIAIRLAGGAYTTANQELRVDDGTFELMRTYYNMFGLGVKTGIDLPDEQTGYVGPIEEAGKIIPFSIGQYDTYTAMQLAQYVATVANGGNRIEPHVLKSVSEVNSDRKTVLYEVPTKILSTLAGDNVAENLKVVQDGMRDCVVGERGICPSTLDDTNTGTKLAAKTGTSENTVTDEETKAVIDTATSSVVAYGPYEDGKEPEIVFACVAPNANVVTNDPGDNLCGEIVGDISNYYFTEKNK
ncbi:peptidoglycan D,D-transpeptidase FtsI family protein [Breznakia pachnodae]|uniref:Penicillin-binding protein 3 n=1 Tax=Breznakia pachnodae TaxID=265178 RepID=A0ABU0E7U8_9FIRM|nr:penicillin-binding protein 2 [Breznakia pachnodae]MDQ0362962.1 penicillin-binding protein 3 [Breznakia pachnodae]